MQKDERLLPLPTNGDLKTMNHDYPASYSPLYDDDFVEKRSFREYFIIIYKRLPLILALTILTTAAVAFYMYRQPSIFEAQTGVIIEPRKPKLTSKESININFGNDMNYHNTQLKLLQNPDLMKEVVLRLGLYRDPNLFGKKSESFFSSLGSVFAGEKEDAEKNSSLPILTEASLETSGTERAVLTPEEKARVEAYSSTLLGGLDVDQVEKTNLVMVSVRDTNPVLAAKVADAVAEVFIDLNANRETEGARKAYEDLSNSIDKLRPTIEEQQQELIRFMRDAGLPLQENGESLSAGRLSTLSSQWLTAMDERRKLEARYEGAVRANARGEGSTMPDLIASEIYRDAIRINAERRGKLQDSIREIDKQINDAETEKAQLLVKYTPEYYKVKERDEQISK
ncbi:MAG TPA: Wzz/FepE/Etk N-terminal domain-containing protein, partial [Pyrinomonadaceae bacterium]|nr:Wzz/FepE/Etk N-terminal domain-containing protein [Pyrinomonadaceae bacterium]